MATKNQTPFATRGGKPRNEEKPGGIVEDDDEESSASADQEPRIDALALSPLSTPADGNTDPVLVEFQGVDELAEASGQYFNLVMAARNGLWKCRRVVWRLADTHDSAMKANADALQQGANVEGFRIRVATEIKDKLRSVNQKVAGNAAQAAADAMKALVLRVDQERSAILSPKSLRSNSGDTWSLLASARLEAELENMRARANSLGPILELITEKARLGLEDELDRILDAVVPVTTKVLQMPAPRAVAEKMHMGSYQAGDVDKDRATARRIMSIIDARRLDSVPGELLAADACIEKLRPIFRQTIGKDDARFLSKGDFYSRYIMGSGSSEALAARSVWEIDPEWPCRFIDGAGKINLPGWSPVKQRDRVTGNITR